MADQNTKLTVCGGVDFLKLINEYIVFSWKVFVGGKV